MGIGNEGRQVAQFSVQEIWDVLERWAPASHAFDWDRVGLSIGEPGAQVRKALVCLTVTPAAVAAAKRARAQIIVSHHPLIWNPIAALRTDDPHVRLCLEIVEAGIACFAAHTNLDVVPGGVNHVLAESLGLVDTTPLFQAPQATQLKLICFVPETHLTVVREALARAGAGEIGDYTHCTFCIPGTGTFRPKPSAHPYAGEVGKLNEEPEIRVETLFPSARRAQVLRALRETHPYEEPAYDLQVLENVDPAVALGVRGRLPKPITLRRFAEQVGEALEVEHVRMIGQGRGRVQTVAVLGGSGGGSIGKVPQAVDVFVTGDVKYHDALLAEENGLKVIDAGHAGTEKGIVPVMARHLKEHLKGLAVTTYMEPELFQLVADHRR